MAPTDSVSGLDFKTRVADTGDIAAAPDKPKELPAQAAQANTKPSRTPPAEGKVLDTVAQVEKLLTELATARDALRGRLEPVLQPHALEKVRDGAMPLAEKAAMTGMPESPLTARLRKLLAALGDEVGFLTALTRAVDL